MLTFILPGGGQQNQRCTPGTGLRTPMTPTFSPLFPSGAFGVPLRLVSLLLAALLLLPLSGSGQEKSRLFPPGSLMPTLLAGPRDPVSSATLLGVFRNPNAHGPGLEAEVSLGLTFPVLLLAGTLERNPVVLGVEAAAFARFGLQVLERELVATDWLLAVPVIWHHHNGWTRARFYHSSSHMGDEYARRFQDQGTNFSRDAAEVFLFRRPTPVLGSWVGARFGYNVHPQENHRWVLRTGTQLEALPDSGRFLPFLAADAEWDQEASMRPRVEIRIGAWLPEQGGRRTLRISLTLLTGPSPLGQFGFRPTTQVGLSLQGNL